MRLARLIIWHLFAALNTASLAHAEAGQALADALVHDSEVTLHFRTHYLERDKSAAADSLSWAAGGWFGYRSGWLEVIAEGVEETEQVRQLRSLQCDVMQGYFISKPLPADEMTRFLASFKPPQMPAVG